MTFIGVFQELLRESEYLLMPVMWCLISFKRQPGLMLNVADGHTSALLENSAYRFVPRKKFRSILSNMLGNALCRVTQKLCSNGVGS